MRKSAKIKFKKLKKKKTAKINLNTRIKTKIDDFLKGERDSLIKSVIGSLSVTE